MVGHIIKYALQSQLVYHKAFPPFGPLRGHLKGLEAIEEILRAVPIQIYLNNKRQRRARARENVGKYKRQAEAKVHIVSYKG